MAHPVGSEAFNDVVINYPPWATEADKYSAEDTRLCVEYIGAIVADAEVLRPMLDESFAHVDGALVVEDGEPVVQNVGAIVGRDAFVDGFRRMVNSQTQPDGAVQGTWIPAADYERVLAPQVNELLPPGVTMTGRLIGACAARFPYRLREGGALDLPPPLHGMLAEGEQPFEPHHPHSPEADPDLDRFGVNVIQAVYADDNDKITGRVGLVYDDPSGRAVPFAIHHQLSEREAGRVPVSPEPQDIATLVHNA